jgi:peptide/nickel transport system ATP-binding protein
MNIESTVRESHLLLDVRGLSTMFSTNAGEVIALDGVDLRVGAGMTVGIVGESGSGKSTIARTIMGLTPSAARSTGSVLFDGVELLGRPMKHLLGDEISMIFQDPATALNPVMRIGKQITEVLRVHRGLNRAEAKKRALELLEQVGIPEPARRLRSYPHEMSGGMRQRVCIAIAIACSPRLLFADEPTTALDVTIQRQILDLLDAIRTRAGMAVVLVTHDLAVVAGRTDEVVVLYAGRVVEAGPTATIFANPRHPYTVSLLNAVPRMDLPPHSRLAVIPGQPARVLGVGGGCRFAPRCFAASAQCFDSQPIFAATAEDERHRVACFHPVLQSAGTAAARGRE